MLLHLNFCSKKQNLPLKLVIYQYHPKVFACMDVNCACFAVLWQCPSPEPLPAAGHQGDHPPAPHGRPQQQADLRPPLRPTEARDTNTQERNNQVFSIHFYI